MGLPTLNIIRVPTWPTTDPEENVESDNVDSDMEVDIIGVDEKDENVSRTKYVDSEMVLVQLKQLQLLLNKCYYCGHLINCSSQTQREKGGIFFVSYNCTKCNTKRYWRSFKGPFTQMLATGALLSGINFAKIILFFGILKCIFPTSSPFFYAARVVRPIIEKFFNHQRSALIENLRRTGSSIHLCIDGQYDSPGYCAQNCTVTAIEASSQKVVDFVTVRRCEANNKLGNAEPIAFTRLLNKLLSEGLTIATVTTDNSRTLNSLFREKYPFISHRLDLWHLMRNIYRKLAPRFNRVSFYVFLIIVFFKFRLILC